MQRNVRFPILQCLFGVLVALAFSPGLGQDLPPQIQVDRLLVQAEREARAGNYFSAALTLDRALDLHEEHGLEVPAEFWFRQAEVLQQAELHERAVEASTRYLREAARDGEHYQAVLVILDAAEVGLAEARRAEARARAAAEQAEREAAARAATIAASVPEMVVIPTGDFRMGCVTGRRCEDWETPVREVRVPSFEISRNEVTFAQWDICVEYRACRWVPDGGWGRADRPVIGVTWHDAQAYVSWLRRETGDAFRLPTEAEWEYAARAGAETRTIWGNSVRRDQANWDSERTRPVGSYAANGFGLNDMFGNVGEWVEDCWHNSLRGAPSDGGAWVDPECSFRVWRGGSWAVREATGLGAANRWGRDPDQSFRTVGFRIARSLNR